MAGGFGEAPKAIDLQEGLGDPAGAWEVSGVEVIAQDCARSWIDQG